MANLAALDSQVHRQLRIASPRSAAGNALGNAVGVIPREFHRLLAYYPIFFTHSGETVDADGKAQFEPTALLGFAQQENLFLTGDRWDVGYVPLQIQRHPFSLIPRRGVLAPGEQAALDVALDFDSPHVQSQEGERLFTDEGQPSKYLQSMSSMLATLVSGAAEAVAFTRHLVVLELIEPLQIEIKFIDGSNTRLQGLHSISAARLKALPAAQLAELRDRGHLEWMYFQMASLAQVSPLVERKNRLLVRAKETAHQ
jgi:hypothetical protein